MSVSFIGHHLLVAMCLSGCLTGCGSFTKPEPHETVSQQPASGQEVPSAVGSRESDVVNPRDIPVPRASTPHVVRVDSTPPGANVFLGFESVKTENDTLLQTPCELQFAKGAHPIRVEHPNGAVGVRVVDVPRETEVTFELGSEMPTETEKPTDTGDDKTIVKPDTSKTPDESDPVTIRYSGGPYFDAAIGEPLALATLNTPDREFDPCLSVDGLTIWFVSDRGGQKGIYSAKRPSPYHEFGPATFVEASASSDLPASPTVTADGLMMVYAVPDKARLWQLSRKSTAVDFEGKELIRSDESAFRAWRSAQISGDGLRLYWTEEGGDDFVSRAALRDAKSHLFGKTLSFALHDTHPHLSADGYRHFSFDGAKLQRSRRGTVKQQFSPPEVISERPADGYQASPRHRQFTVSEDEQWLIYSDRPRSGGDLFLMRLSDGPAWGRTPRGKPVEPKVVATTTPTDEKPSADKPAEKMVDPRTLPLPYTAHWKQLLGLLKERQVAEAADLVKQSRSRNELQASRELLDWDAELVELASQFEQDAADALKSLKKGTAVRIGGVKFDFEFADEESIHLKLKDKEVVKKLKSLTPGETIQLIDLAKPRPDAEKAIWFATFLVLQDSVNDALPQAWLKRAGDAGKTLEERFAARELHQALGEFARENMTEGIAFLDAAIEIDPNSETGKRASKERLELYDKFEWRMVGKRKWQRGDYGEYTADKDRSNGSYLQSALQYEDFEVMCEWKVTGSTGMGGIYVRFDGTGNPFENGTKIQFANDSQQKGVDQYSTGSLFGSDAPKLNAGLAEGKWNETRLRVRKQEIEVEINGKSVLKTSLGKKVPAKGYVVLDGVAGGISYRKLLIVKLPSE